MMNQPIEPTGDRTPDGASGMSTSGMGELNATLNCRRSYRLRQYVSPKQAKEFQDHFDSGWNAHAALCRFFERALADTLASARQSTLTPSNSSALPPDSSDPDELIEYAVTVLPLKIKHTVTGRMAYNRLFRSLLEKYAGQAIQIDVVMTTPEEPDAPTEHD